MELQTAQRIGFTTSLRWLKLDGQRIVSVIDNTGTTHAAPKSPQELCCYYKDSTGRNPEPHLFADFAWPRATNNPTNTRKEKKLQQKNQAKQKEAPKKETIRKENAATMSETNTESPKHGPHELHFSDTVEVVHELCGHYKGELKYLMEFEAWDDLIYRYTKLKEKMPEYSFSYRTKRSVVNYGKLE